MAKAEEHPVRLSTDKSSVTMIVGGVSVRVNGCPGPYQSVWGREGLFLGESANPDLDLIVEERRVISLPEEAVLVFDARPLWTMHTIGERFLLSIWNEDVIGQLAEIGTDSRRGRILVPSDGSRESLASRALRYPLLLLLVAWRTVRQGGLLLHACGVVWREAGLSFCGRSNAGKTTTSRLWGPIDQAIVLNDDRVVVRPGEEGFRLMGTPWYGDGQVCANDEAPLRALLCIRHGRENRLERLSGARAVAEVLATGILPFYDPTAMERAQDTCVRLVGTVPIWAYEFVPDQSAVTYLQQFLLAEGLVED